MKGRFLLSPNLIKKRKTFIIVCKYIYLYKILQVMLGNLSVHSSTFIEHLHVYFSFVLTSFLFFLSASDKISRFSFFHLLISFMGFFLVDILMSIFRNICILPNHFIRQIWWIIYSLIITAMVISKHFLPGIRTRVFKGLSFRRSIQ